MYEIFIRPKPLFEAIAETIDGTKCRVVFQRFDSPKGKAGYKAADMDASPWKEYIDGGYSVIFVTKGALPSKPDDWKFMDREAARMIEIRGGRMDKKNLEIAVLRKVAKKSEMDSLFRKLTSALDAVADEGVLLDSHPYPKIRAEKNLKGLSLYLDIDSKDVKAVPV